MFNQIVVQYTWLREAITEAHESVLICHSAASQTPVGESIYRDKQSELKTERAQGRHPVSYDSLYQYPNCLNLSATMQPSPVSSAYLGNTIIVIKLNIVVFPKTLSNLPNFAESFSGEEEEEMARGNQQRDKKQRGEREEWTEALLRTTAASITLLSVLYLVPARSNCEQPLDRRP